VSMNYPVAQRGGPGGWLGASILAARPTSLSLSPASAGGEEQARSIFSLTFSCH
jgi:hypothetical protein